MNNIIFADEKSIYSISDVLEMLDRYNNSNYPVSLVNADDSFYRLYKADNDYIIVYWELDVIKKELVCDLTTFDKLIFMWFTSDIDISEYLLSL